MDGYRKNLLEKNIKRDKYAVSFLIELHGYYLSQSAFKDANLMYFATYMHVINDDLVVIEKPISFSGDIDTSDAILEYVNKTF